MMKNIACLPLRRLAWIPTFTIVAMLAACYVVPIDPRTGLPYPLPTDPRTGPVYPAQMQSANTNMAGIPLPSATIVQAKLYPLNAQANKAGVLIATATDNDSGRGTFNVTFMGEPMQGDASRVTVHTPGFGRIYKEVLGVSFDPSKNKRRGIANGVGASGTSVQCEYEMTSKDVGTGVCLFSNGAKYQMHFGA
jgi:hypothetical protein